jgi:hypothetical protein
MNNILNPRVKKLIKDELLDYAKGGFLFFVIIAIMLAVIEFTVIDFNVNSRIIDTDMIPDVLAMSQYFFSVSMINGFSLVMLIAGIVAGAELAIHVRQGVARNEYFKATLIGAIIVSIIYIPFALLLFQLVNLIVGSGSVVYDISLIVLFMYMLLFIMFYLIGYLIAMIYQRFGWIVGVMITLFALVLFGVISRNSDLFIMIPEFLFFVGNQTHSLVDFVAPELLGPILVMVSVVLASGSYVLMKNISVKVK